MFKSNSQTINELNFCFNGTIFVAIHVTLLNTTNMKKIILVSIIAAAFFITSCETDNGGNADMQTIDIVVDKGDWNDYGIEGEPGYGFAVDINMPELTANVVQNGLVSLYMKSGESWLPVPVYFYNDGFQGGYLYAVKQGVFSIEYYESDHFTVRPDTHIFRLVIVQPV